MKITDVKIEGFGVWRDLELRQLSPRLTLFFGANEAGKTTLMQFVRAVLYGVSPARRKRYLPPVHGGRPGGALSVTAGQEQLQISRIAERGHDDIGLVSITTQEGKATGDRLLREALAGVDEPTYNNIFAIGLSEIQQLGTLSDTQAAESLYRLTSGLDRVSLYDVIQGLRTRCNALLSSDPAKSQIDQLLARRGLLVSEIKQLVQKNRRWARLAVQIEELVEQIAEQEKVAADCEHQSRTIEIAVAIKPKWRSRAKITRQLQQLTSSVQLPDDAIARLDELNAKIESHQREADILKGQRRQLRDESERLAINELLVKNSSRIEALGEQRDWLQSLERQIDDLEAEAEELELQLEEEHERLGAVLGVADHDHLQTVRSAEIKNLQPQITKLRAAQKQVDRAQSDFDALAEGERSLKVRIESAIVGGEHHGLPMDISESTDLVARLRKRLKVEQRLEQARSHEVELEQQSHELIEDRVMPLGLFSCTFAAVVLGGLLMGVWLWWPGSPLGSAGSLIALGGLATAIFCFIFKHFTEESAADQLDACQRQIEVVTRQIEEAEQARQQLDAELPMAEGSISMRLEAAERHLAELEGVLPVEAQRRQAGHEVLAAESRLAEAGAQLDKALAAWRGKLVGLGFSEELDPERFLAVTERYEALADLENRAKLRREEAVARRRELAMLTRRVGDLMAEVGCVLESDETEVGDDGEEYEVELSTLDQLEYLVSERHRQLGEVERREEIFEQAKELKAEEGRHRRAIAGIGRRREAALNAADCDDQAAYRRLADDQQKAAKLRKQRKSLSREITAAIGGHTSEQLFAELLSTENVGRIDELWERTSTELETARGELNGAIDRRGALRQQQRTMAEDRSLADRQLELSCVEKQLLDARQSWREHATVSRVLERIRSDYEANRQPETLAEASRYMKEFTGGEYLRIWTPLADDILLVENSAGESLGVDLLSRGTREQLLLSVRLAVVATFARRGINLPMVLDDVLVNFDAVRAERAAKVLCDFAHAGHQMLVFTCHETIWQMFESLDSDCQRLPNRLVKTPPSETAEKPKTTKPKEQHPPVPSPEPLAPPQFYDYPFVEEIEEEVVDHAAS